MVESSQRPEYLVIFNEPDEDNVRTLANILGEVESVGVSSIEDVTALESGVCVYNGLGIAASDLTDDQLATIKRDDHVEEVVRNEVRSLPPLVNVPLWTANLSPLVNSDPFLFYLRGARDAIEIVQRFYMGLDSPGSQPLSSPASDLAREPFSWCLDLLGMSPDYEIATGRGIKVAVLDTGIDLNHPDFRDQELGSSGRCKNFVVNGEDVQDGHGHGTHCAGVVVGPRESFGGQRYGVAPDAEILVGKVLSNRGRGYDDQIIDGIQWAEKQGAKVISMSLSSPRRSGEKANPLYERITTRLYRRGILTISAAGNDSRRPQHTKPVQNPAACRDIKAVASVIVKEGLVTSVVAGWTALAVWTYLLLEKMFTLLGLELDFRRRVGQAWLYHT